MAPGPGSKRVAMSGARRRSTIRPRIGQGRGVRWQDAVVVSRRVRIDIGAQHTVRENEKRAPKVLTRENQDQDSREVTALSASGVNVVTHVETRSRPHYRERKKMWT